MWAWGTLACAHTRDSLWVLVVVLLLIAILGNLKDKNNGELLRARGTQQLQIILWSIQTSLICVGEVLPGVSALEKPRYYRCCGWQFLYPRETFLWF
jgi:hypothetical protein